jgi:hypothetical protein
MKRFATADRRLHDIELLKDHPHFAPQKQKLPPLKLQTLTV